MSRYDNAEKRRWREWCWSSVAEMLCKHAGQACGMYLIGDSTADLEEAQRQGFVDYNLIGVDTELSAVKLVRSAGGLAVHANALDVFRAWPSAVPLDFACLDFKGGLTRRNVEVIKALLESAAVRDTTVCLFNLLRGRDNDKVTQIMTDPSKLDTRFNYKHRGFKLLCLLAGWSEDKRHISSDEVRDVRRRCNARSYAYRSGNLCYDSLILHAPERFNQDEDADDSVVRKMRAMQAVRTMRVDKEFDEMCGIFYREQLEEDTLVKALNKKSSEMHGVVGREQLRRKVTEMDNRRRRRARRHK